MVEQIHTLAQRLSILLRGVKDLDYIITVFNKLFREWYEEKRIVLKTFYKLSEDDLQILDMVFVMGSRKYDSKYSDS